MEVVIVPDATAGGELIAETIASLLSRKPDALLGVATGSTPLPIYQALAAKVRALLDARYNVSFEDVRRVFLPALRHRVIVNFEAQAEGIDSDKVLLEILQKAPEKDEA